MGCRRLGSILSVPAFHRQTAQTMLPLGPNQPLRLYAAALKLFQFALRLDQVCFCSEVEEALGKAMRLLLQLQDEHVLATLCRGACPQGREDWSANWRDLRCRQNSAVGWSCLWSEPEAHSGYQRKCRSTCNCRAPCGSTVATRGSTADRTIGWILWTTKKRIWHSTGPSGWES